MSAFNAVVRKELRDASRSRWVVGFAATFTVTALALSLAQAQGGEAGQGFNRTTAGLVNLCLLLVPLLALVLGAGSIAGERERGTLASLLAQPLSSGELLLAKYVGLTLAIWAAIALGFGAAALILALLQPISNVGGYALFVLLAGGLATTMLSLGILVSVWSGSRLQALAAALVLWFALVLFYDLAAIGLAVTLAPSGQVLVLAVVANPVEVARILTIMGLDPELRVLGPLGAYLVNEVGVGPATALLVAALVTWTAAPLIGAHLAFNRDDYD